MVFLILFGAISTPSHAAYDFSLDDNIDENELMMVKAQLQDELEVINQKLSSKIMDPEITGKLEAEKLALEGVVRRLQVVEWWHSAGKKGKIAVIAGSCAAIGATVFTVWGLSKLWSVYKENKKLHRTKTKLKRSQGNLKKRVAELDSTTEELRTYEALLAMKGNQLDRANARIEGYENPVLDGAIDTQKTSVKKHWDLMRSLRPSPEKVAARKAKKDAAQTKKLVDKALRLEAKREKQAETRRKKAARAERRKKKRRGHEEVVDDGTDDFGDGGF